MTERPGTDERRPRRLAWVLVLGIALVPIVLIGGCTGLVWINCNRPPPAGPLEDRLPGNAEVLGSEDWCGDPPDAYRGTWVDIRQDWCVRTITVRADGMSAQGLREDLAGRFADFGGNDNSVDLGFGISTDPDAGSDASDAVVVAQARGC